MNNAKLEVFEESIGSLSNGNGLIEEQYIRTIISLIVNNWQSFLRSLNIDEMERCANYIQAIKDRLSADKLIFKDKKGNYWAFKPNVAIILEQIRLIKNNL